MAADGQSPVVQRRRLRAELRKARLEAGLTQEQVAAAMDWSLSKVIRIEAGSVGVSTNDLKALAQAARERAWWSGYRDVTRPGLLQPIGPLSTIPHGAAFRGSASK